MTDNRFKIDFFEFIFLLETCIPPVPIARAMFWERTIDEIYHQLTDNEKAKTFRFITENHRFDDSNEDCRLFYARFNPENQYVVKYVEDFKTKEIDCFRYNDKYHVSKNRWINEDYVAGVEKKLINS